MSMDILAKIGQSAEETEFYTPLPPGYRKSHHKFVVVVGTVMSGLGKGIFSSSLAKLLQDKGLKVAPIKMEGYYNIDSGTLNPYRHGEVFVLDDGMECDMDLGTYERLLDQDLSGANFCTNGQIFSSVLKKEREGSYLGRDVQTIPHVTGEVKLKLRELAVKTDADVVFVEVGGTVGDYENGVYLEACRELAYEEGEGSVVFVALTYVLEPNSLGEQKSKAAQLGIKRLMEMGIMPSIVACRATNPVGDKVRQKISMHANVPMRRVVSMHDVNSIYLVPEALRDAGIDREVLTLLDLHDRVDQRHEDQARMKWRWFVDRIGKSSREITIGVTGKYTALRDAMRASSRPASTAAYTWTATCSSSGSTPPTSIPPTSPGAWRAATASSSPAALACAAPRARSSASAMPAKTTCRTWACAWASRWPSSSSPVMSAGSSARTAPSLSRTAPNPVIDILPEQKKIEGLGGNMRLGGKDVLIKPGTLASKLFNGATQVRLRFRHRYEVDPRYIETMERQGMVFSGKAPNHPIMQILELPRDVHPFFVGTQAHPELTSRPLRPSPLFFGLIQSALNFSPGRIEKVAVR